MEEKIQARIKELEQAEREAVGQLNALRAALSEATQQLNGVRGALGELRGLLAPAPVISGDSLGEQQP